MSSRRRLSVAAAATVVLASALLPSGAEGCTIIAVGKDASASGAPMVGHSEDSGPSANDVRLIRVPRRKWPKNSKRPLYNVQATYPRIVDSERSPEYAPAPHSHQAKSEPLGYIPQVEETFGYWDLDYGLQNEMGLSIGESTCTANTVGWPADPDKPYGYNKAGIEELSKIALERCATARCAVQTMGDIAVELGFYSADSGLPSSPGYVGSSECLTLADAEGELWNFNILTGKNNASAIWAAERVPPNHIAVVANAFTIRRLNLSDSDNFLHSPDVTKLAEEMGWWTKDLAPEKDIFDFFYAYGWTPPEDVVPSNMKSILAYYSGRRMWRAFSLLSPEEGEKLDPSRGNIPHTRNPYPGSVPAKARSVTVAMVQHTYRDHYEGTPYDLTVGMAAGPFGNPNRGPSNNSVIGQWERALSMYRTSWSFVCEARAHGLSVVWFGYDAPHGTVYLPFYGAATSGAPESYRSHDGGIAKFSFEVAWWPFNFVNQYSETNWKLINGAVREKATEIETEARRRKAVWEHDAGCGESPEERASPKALEELTRRSNELAREVVKQWWNFSFHLVTKYRGYVITNNATPTGVIGNGVYPSWWLESLDVGFSLWSASGPFHGVPDGSPFREELVAEASEDPVPAQVKDWRLVAIVSTFAAALVGTLAAGVAFEAGKRAGQRDCTSDSYVACA